MSRRVLVVVLPAAAAAFLAAASPAGAVTKRATAGATARNAPRQFDANAFFPRRITVHTGDRVRWAFDGFHTVTFPARGQTPPAFVVPDMQRPVQGLTDAAGAPFWFNGQPTLIANPMAAAPVGPRTYDGSTYVNSGVPTGNRPKPYTLRFTKTGVFTYYCLVHPGMKATVAVVPRRRPVPNRRADAAAARLQLSRLVTQARRAAAHPAPSGATVQVGRSATGFSLQAFFPATLTVRTGQTVTFTMARQPREEIHTVTFGPAAMLSQLEQTFLAPLPGTTPPVIGVNPQGVYPSDPPTTPPSYDGANHGNGFLNLGVLDNDRASPQPVSATLTFTKAGTYSYECLIHPRMDGRVVVTG